MNLPRTRFAGEPRAKLDPAKIWMTKTLPVSQKSAEIMKNINHNEPLVRGHRDHREQGKISAFFSLFLRVLCDLRGFFLKKIPLLNCGSSLGFGAEGFIERRMPG
jgi:hypothetical protein